MKFEVEKIRAQAEEDFEKAWKESARLLRVEKGTHRHARKTKTHPLMDLVIEVRKILLDEGFTEVVLPMIVDSAEVVKQYGPEAPVILDRVFFLAGLERPDIGMSKEKKEAVLRLVPGFDRFEELQSILRRYKRGEVSADDLLEVMVKELGISEEEASEIVQGIFPKFKEMEPVPSTLSLRSHTTSLWFPTLAEFLKRETLPIQLFSIGPKFRREQRLDRTHLYESWTASLVEMDEDLSLEDGKELTRRIFERLGFKEVELRTKMTTSKYYAPGMEFEVFLISKGEEVEVADGGMYSPVALSRYGIPYPVFNLGIGLERLLMVRMGEEDVRRLVYPHLYVEPSFSDQELAKMVRIGEKPQTEEGKRIAEAIVEVAKRHADAPSPCEFEVYRGEVGGRKVVVKLVEPEEGTKLIGPAGFNTLYVFDGNLVGLPPEGWRDDEFLKKVRREGVNTGITYMQALASLAARRIEEAAKEGKPVKVRVRNVKSPSDINVVVEEVAQRYLTSKQKKVDVRGPVFTTITAEFL
ncbi:MAG: O-phosphoserine--tRNA ligase [Candidatus Hadarchaeales archaeon]